MDEKKEQKAGKGDIGDLSLDDFDTVLSVDEVAHQAEKLAAEAPSRQRLSELVGKEPLLTIEGLRAGYGKMQILHEFDLQVGVEQSLCIIGPNGAGKTTLFKTILNQLPPLSGELMLGASLHIGYFAQAHEDLDPERSLVQEIVRHKRMAISAARSYLAQYLFRGEDVFKPVSVLSGGERGRLALAKLALSNANLLLLDEPTNHLDIPAQEVLQNVMADFDGTVILVSHDRYLIDALGTQIWEINKDESRLEIFKGTYSEYRAFQESQENSEGVGEGTRSQSAAAFQGERAAKNRALADERRRQARVVEVEARVAKLEVQLAEISAQLALPPTDPAEILRLSDDYVEIQNELEALIAEWEQLLS
ncbi:MAG TPA: hypothetical protein DEH25_03505 [Chloroflexi bacterium]|nr:hypothetical protein [Chloroflexota bacterium]